MKFIDRLFTSRKLIIAFFILDAAFIFLHFTHIADFNLDFEYNLPTLFQSFKLLLVGFLCFELYSSFRTKKPERASWLLLTIAFVYLAFDEWWQIHERISDLTARILEATVGPVNFAAWLIPYAPLIVLGLWAFYLIYNYILNEEEIRKTGAHMFFLAGAVCFGLVPVVELLGTWGWDMDTGRYMFLVALEEGFEMVGASSFLGYCVVMNKLRRGTKLKGK